MKRSMRRQESVAFFAAAFSLAVSAGVAQGDVNKWSSIGPESEPTVHSLVVDPRSPTRIYAGAIGAIWRTDDAGNHWTAAETPLTRQCEIRGLAIDIANPSTLYAGCLGVIKTIDGGNTWTAINVGIAESGALPVVWSIAIDPSTAATVYAGAPQGIVFKSVNGGATWQRTGALPNGAREVRALTIDPVSPNTIYAGATVGGVFKSIDGGGNWTSENKGITANAVTSLAIDPRSPATLYAGTIGSGVFKTIDGASSWTEVFGPKNVGGMSFTVAELAIDPLAPSTIFMAVGDAELDLGIFQTTDAGATWRQMSSGLPSYPAVRALAIAPGSLSTVYVGLIDQYSGYVDGGVFAFALANRCPAGPATAGIVEFAVPTANAAPLGIAAGPDCALWFTEDRGNRIGRITATGEITEFPIPTPFSNPARIVSGPDGALWFTETSGNKIGRVTTEGVFREFAIPTLQSYPVGIAVGSDGNLWFAEQGGKKIGRITPAGVIREFLIPPRGAFDAAPHSIAAGPDGNLWFSERFTGRIGRITTSGTITLFIVEPSCCGEPGEITAGPDGNLWFTDDWDNKIVRLTPSGIMDSLLLGTPGFGGGSTRNAYGIAAGPDGALWFTHTGGWVGRITTDGVFSMSPVPTANADPEIITAGPDGNMWFTELKANKIGRITTGPAAPQSPFRRRTVRQP